MLEFTVSSTQRLPVVLKSTSGTAFNGAAYNAVAFSIVKANGVQYDLTLVSASWQQITGTAYLNQGYYNYIMTGSDLDTTGVFQYCVYISGAVPYFGVVKVVDGDTGAIYNRIGMPVSGSISNDIQNIPTSVASGGFGASDRALLSATYATVSLLPSDPASNSYLSGVIHVIDPTTNILAIKAKTDNLPSDPVGISSMNGALTQTISTIDAHTDGQFTVIKGGSWTTQTLYDIGLHVSQTWYSATFVPWLNSTDALTYFSKTWGDGFVTGTDDLHGLSLQIQGITPGSGGGGFSSADRAALYATYTATLPLPSDPASESQLSGVIHSSTLNILGLYPYGAASQSVPAYTSYTLYQVWQTESLIKSSTDHLPTIGTVATVTDVNNARDYLAGTGYVQASNSLVAITNLITASNFTPTDRAVLDGISASVGFGLTGTANSILSDVVAIKAKTDLLPNDVVSSSSIFPVLYDISASLGASGGFSTSDRDNIIYISQTLGKPQAATVSADILGIINTQATQGTTITNIFSKVNNLPVDPASNTFVNQVSQSLSTLITASISASTAQITSSLSSTISASNSGLSGVLHTVHVGLSGNISSTFWSLSGTLGVPTSTIAGDIAAVKASADLAASNAASAATYAQNAYTEAQAVDLKLGTPMSGTVSADISATYHAVLGVSSTFSGTISASVDLSPVLKVLGTPVKSVSEDIFRVGAMTQQVGAAVQKIPHKK